MKHELLAPGGVMLCDNVLYRGLVAQHQAGEMPDVSEKTAKNAAALDSFLQRVRQDRDGGRVRTLMMPVRDGMLALTIPADLEQTKGTEGGWIERSLVWNDVVYPPAERDTTTA